MVALPGVVGPRRCRHRDAGSLRSRNIALDRLTPSARGGGPGVEPLSMVTYLTQCSTPEHPPLRHAPQGGCGMGHNVDGTVNGRFQEERRMDS